MKDHQSIAIVGMACIFPGAPDLVTFWENILEGRDAIGPIPDDRGPDSHLWPGEEESDRIVCTHGGFIENHHPFAPLDYGIMPRVCEVADPEQLLILQQVDQALRDAGIDPASDDLADTETILGRGGYLSNYLQEVHLRSQVITQVLAVLRDLHPDLDDSTLAAVRGELRDCFRHLDHDVVPFGIPNIGTGRVANRFDMMGGNFTVDAACASALIAVQTGVMALRQGRCERVVTGGVFLASNPSFWWTFSRLGALSSSGTIRPFSEDADGMLVGEGIGILVLEPLSEAVKRGRRIYALIRGVGSSSDGRGTSVLAPGKEGQLACLRRAYQDAGFSPHCIDLVEGHGTGTPAGDQTELETLKEFFGPDASGVPIRALGSVKSMIGHAMPAAGAAAMIKAALAIYHGIMPMTLHGERPSKRLRGSSFYLNTESRPWVHPPSRSRRAGVNAFGFGGVNAHVILEEYVLPETYLGDNPLAFPSELFLFGDQEMKGLLEQARDLQAHLGAENVSLAVHSYRVCQRWKAGRRFNLAIVADNHQELKDKLDRVLALEAVEDLEGIGWDSGIYFTARPLGREGKVCFIFPGNAFPGLGDDYTRRLGQLCMYFPFFRRWFDRLDEEEEREGPGRPYRFSTMLFPPPGLEHGRLVDLKRELRRLANSAKGVFMANAASCDLMTRMGVEADMVTGTSLGEWSALLAGGAITMEEVMALGTHTIRDEDAEIIGALGMCRCSAGQLDPFLAQAKEEGYGVVTLALDLSPRHAIFGGTRPAVQKVAGLLKEAGIWCEHFNLIPIHTPLCEPIAANQRGLLRELDIAPQKIPIYSGSLGGRYPQDPEQARSLLADNTVLPVRMRELFNRLYSDGARIFIQLGGGGKIIGPLEETLESRQFMAMALDVPNRHSVTQLLHLAAGLAAHGLSLDTRVLFHCRRSFLQGDLAVGKGRRKEEMSVPLKMEAAAMRIANPPPLKEAGPFAGSPRQESSVAVSASGPLNMQALAARQMGIAARINALQMEEEMAVTSDMFQALSQQQALVVGGDGVCPRETARDRELLPDISGLPFVDGVVSHVPGREVVVRRVLDLDHDRFLLDHAFLPLPDEVKPAAERIPTLPVAVAMEIMAEAAQVLFPGYRPVSVRDVKCNHWIELGQERPSLPLFITARAATEIAAGRTRVNCTIKSCGPDGRPAFGASVIMASKGADFYRIEVAFDTKAGATRPCRLDPATIYRPGALYHGPCFQGIQELIETGERTISAVLRVPENAAFFQDRDPAGMLLAPAAIDIASQLIACWAWENGDMDIWVAPVSIKAVDVLSESPVPGEQLWARMFVRQSRGRIVEFDLLLEKNSGPWLAVTGWQDWRMRWSPGFTAVWKGQAGTNLARETRIGSPWDIEGREFSPVLFRVRAPVISGADLRWVARLYLSRKEFGRWEELGKSARLPWLLGRIAAKDAVRTLATGRGRVLYPSQVEILDHQSGRPYVHFPGQRSTDPAPLISISHKEDEACACALLAGKGLVGLGVDMEIMEKEITPSFLDAAFNDGEIPLVSGTPPDLSPARVLQAWCAKEAAAKALDQASPYNPRRFSVVSMDGDGSGSELSVRCRDYGGEVISRVKTLVEGDRVYALCLSF